MVKSKTQAIKKPNSLKTTLKRKVKKGDALPISIFKVITATLGGGILFMSENIIKYGFTNNFLGAGFIILLALFHNMLYFLAADNALKEDQENQIERLNAERGTAMVDFIPGTTIPKDGIHSIEVTGSGYIPLQLADNSYSIEQQEENQVITKELSLKGLATTQANKIVGLFTSFSSSVANILASGLFLVKFSNTWTNLISYFIPMEPLSKYSLQFVINTLSFGTLFNLLKFKSQLFEKIASVAGVSIVVVLAGFLTVVNTLNGWGTSLSTFISIPGVFDFSFVNIIKSMSKLLFALHNQFAIPRIISNMAKRTGSRFFTAIATASAALVAFYMSVGALGGSILGPTHRGDIMEGLLNFTNPQLNDLYTRAPLVKGLSLGMNGLYTLIFFSASYFAAYEPFSILKSVKFTSRKFTFLLRSVMFGFFALMYYGMTFFGGSKLNMITDICGVINTPYIDHALPALMQLFHYLGIRNLWKAAIFFIDFVAMVLFQGFLGYLVFFQPDNVGNSTLAIGNNETTLLNAIKF